MSTDDPEWVALHRKLASWEARVRAREVEIQKLDTRLRELEQRMQVLRARLAKGTGQMSSVTPEGELAAGCAEGSGPRGLPRPRY